MQRKSFEPRAYKYRHLEDKELLEYVERELSGSEFQRHCREVAHNLGIDEIVVQDVMKDTSYKALKKIQESIVSNRKVKINIYGFLFFVTQVKTDLLKFVKFKIRKS